MVYVFISSLDGETTKAFFRSKRIPTNNIYSAGGLGALAEDLKTGDVVYTISCNRFASVRQVYTFARFCGAMGEYLEGKGTVRSVKYIFENKLGWGNNKSVDGVYNTYTNEATGLYESEYYAYL